MLDSVYEDKDLYNWDISSAEPGQQTSRDCSLPTLSISGLVCDRGSGEPRSSGHGYLGDRMSGDDYLYGGLCRASVVLKAAHQIGLLE